jgi:hypothetical protein
VKVRAGERADELVPAEAHDRVIGTKVRANRGDNGAQQSVASGMARTVISGLQRVDVDEREYEPPVRAARSGYLVRQLELSERAPIRPRQVVELCAHELSPQQLQLACRVVAIDGRLLAIGCSLYSIGGRPHAHLGGPGGIGSAAELFVEHCGRVVARACRLVAGRGGPVAGAGGEIAGSRARDGAIGRAVPPRDA